MPRRLNFAALLLVIFLHAPATVLAQEPQRKTPDQEAREKIRVQSDLVVLSVTVKDARGNLVSGLVQSDFHVFEDGAEQNLVAFTDDGLPLSLIILVDSDMHWNEGSAMAKSLRAIVDGLSDTDEAMVCRYDMLFYTGDSFTDTDTSLMASLKAAQSAAQPSPQYVPPPMVTGISSTTGPPAQAAPVYAGHRPSKAIEDALFASADLLDQRPRGRRRVILLLSDGDNEPKLNHHSHTEVLDSLLQKNISVYTLAVGAQRAKHKFSSLIDYSISTGGDIFYATRTDQMERLYSRITEQARHDYTLAYVPTAAISSAPADSSASSALSASSAPSVNDASPQFHSLRVTVSISNLTASTRSGYRSAPRNPPSSP